MYHQYHSMWPRASFNSHSSQNSHLSFIVLWCKKDPVIVYLQPVNHWWIKEDMSTEREEPPPTIDIKTRQRRLKFIFPPFPQSSSQSCLRGDRCPGNILLIYAAANGVWFMSAVLWTCCLHLSSCQIASQKRIDRLEESFQNADCFVGAYFARCSFILV